MGIFTSGGGVIFDFSLEKTLFSLCLQGSCRRLRGDIESPLPPLGHLPPQVGKGSYFLQFIRMMNHHKAFPKLFFGFLMFRIGLNTVSDWANFLAGWGVVMADTFRAKYRIDHINLIANGNGFVWAFRQAHIAVGTFASDE